MDDRLADMRRPLWLRSSLCLNESSREPDGLSASFLLLSWSAGLGAPRSKFGSFNEGDSVIRTQPLPAAPHPDTYDPEDYPAELGHHFRPLVYKLADAVADALAE